MAFQEVARQAAPRIAGSKGVVTVAWRTTSKRGKPRLVLTFTAPVARRMGWTGKGHAARVFYCAETNRMRVEKATPDQLTAYAISMMGSAAGTATISPPLLHVQRREPAAAEAVPFEVAEDGALILTLPAWAQDKAKVLARQAAERARGAFRMGSAA